MQVEILSRPSYALARVTLNPTEVILAETGAMIAMTRDVTMDTKLRGGFLQSFTRAAFGGESFFTNTFRAPAQGGEIYLAPSLPGDVLSVDLVPNDSLLVQSGSFLASAETVHVDAKWSGARTFFGGEGLIMLRCTGPGMLILSSYGAIHEVDLRPGEMFTVDTGHLVAFSENISFRVRSIGGLRSTLLGGEGLVVDLTGPGRVLMQTRSEGAFLDWLLPRLPKNNNS